MKFRNVITARVVTMETPRGVLHCEGSPYWEVWTP